jgi:hypothetical protein
MSNTRNQIVRDCLTPLNAIVTVAGTAARSSPEVAKLAEQIVDAISQLPL